MKKKKFLVALLSVLCVSTAAVGLTACNDTPGSGTGTGTGDGDDNGHVHVFGETVVTDTDPKIDKDGTGHKSCTVEGCTETEAVTLPKLGYQVSVYLSDGVTPAEGVDVTIKTETVKTDANGYAKLTNFGNAGAYPVKLALGDYAEDYIYSTPVSTTSTTSEIKVTLGDLVRDGKTKETAFKIDGLDAEMEYKNAASVSPYSEFEYYRFIPAESGVVVFDYASNATVLTVYDDKDAVVGSSGSNGILFLNLTAGNSYYIGAQTNYGGYKDGGYYYSFKIRGVTADDIGKTGTLATEVSDGSEYTYDQYCERYFKITLTEGSSLKITASVAAKGSYSSATVYAYSDEACTKMVSLGTYGSLSFNSLSSANPNSQATILKAGTYWFKASLNPYDAEGGNATITLKFETEKVENVTYTLHVKDDSNVPVADMGVSLMDGTITVATGTTDANGNVSFEDVFPGTYDIAINDEAEVYGYTKVATSIGTVDYNITLVNKVDYSFKVYLADGTTPAAGAVVNIYKVKPWGWEATYTLVEYATVDASGSVKFNLLPDNYYYAVTNVPDGYYEPEYPDDECVAVDKSKITTVSLKQLVTYTLTVNGTDGNPIADVAVTVNGITKTTNASGEVTILTLPGEYDVKVKGYTTEAKTSADNFTLTVTAVVKEASSFLGTHDFTDVIIVEETGDYIFKTNSAQGFGDPVTSDDEVNNCVEWLDFANYAEFKVHLEAGQEFNVYAYSQAAGDTFTIEVASE